VGYDYKGATLTYILVRDRIKQGPSKHADSGHVCFLPLKNVLYFLKYWWNNNDHRFFKLMGKCGDENIPFSKSFQIKVNIEEDAEGKYRYSVNWYSSTYHTCAWGFFLGGGTSCLYLHARRSRPKVGVYIPVKLKFWPGGRPVPPTPTYGTYALKVIWKQRFLLEGPPTGQTKCRIHQNSNYCRHISRRLPLV